MTATRCRRHHQNNCAGNLRDGLCNRHRAIWNAMVADWQERADNAAGYERRPPPRPVEEQDKPWTETENDILRTHTAGQARGLLPGRTYSAIGEQRKRLGYARKQWTDADDQVLRTHSTADASALLNRTVIAVNARRCKAGIPAPLRGPWTDIEDQVITRNGIAESERLLDRSRGAIMDRRAHLGISRAQKGSWTAVENAIILQPGTATQIQQQLPHRSVSAITNQRAKLRRGSGGMAEAC